MFLYDKLSDINWHGSGRKTAAEMKKDPQYSALFSTECVLFDNTADEVYSFQRLSELLQKYGASSFDDLEEAIQHSWNQKLPPTLPEVAERLDEQDAALMELAGLIVEG